MKREGGSVKLIEWTREEKESGEDAKNRRGGGRERRPRIDDSNIVLGSGGRWLATSLNRSEPTVSPTSTSARSSSSSFRRFVFTLVKISERWETFQFGGGCDRWGEGGTVVGRVLGEEDIWLSVSSRWWLDHLVISFEWVRNTKRKIYLNFLDFGSDRAWLLNGKLIFRRSSFRIDEKSGLEYRWIKSMVTDRLYRESKIWETIER